MARSSHTLDLDRSEHRKSSFYRVAAPPLPGKQPRRQRPQPLKHPARPPKSRNQNPQQRRADPPAASVPSFMIASRLPAPLRVGVATLRGARRGVAFADAALGNQVRANLGVNG